LPLLLITVIFVMYSRSVSCTINLYMCLGSI